MFRYDLLLAPISNVFSTREKLCKATAIAALVLLTTHVQAATYVWTGLAGSSSWNANNGVFTNWSPNSFPPSSADVQFVQVTPQSTVNLAGTRTVNSLTLGSLQNYTLTGGTLSITTGNVTVNAAGVATNHTLDVPVTLGAAGTFTIADPAKLTVTQAITDGTNPYGLTLAGSGVLVLKNSGNSVFTLTSSGGTLDINGGSVNVRDADGGIYDASFASPVTIENGGSLMLAGGGSNLQINGGASNVITVDGSTSSISGANLFTLGNSGTPGSLHVSHGATITSNFLVVGGIGTGGLTSVATIDSGATVTNSTSGAIGAVTDSVGAMTVTDPASTWHVNNMTLGGFSDSQFGGTGTLTVSNSGQVKVDLDTKFYNSASSILVDKAAYSTAQLETVSGAAPTIQITDTPGKTSLTLNNANLGFTPNFAGTIVDGPTGAGSVLKSGGGAQVFNGHNTYSGGTTISGGTLQLGIEDALSSTGAITVSSGSTLNIGSHTEHVGNFTLTSGTITGTTGATLIANSFTLSAGTVSVPIATSGTITKTTTGTVIDTMPISAGTLAVSQGIFDATGGVQGNISVSSGAQLKARGALTGNVGVGSGSTLTLTGTTIINGNTTISGTLDIGGQTASFTTGHTTQVTTTTVSGGVITAPDGYQVAGNFSGYGTLLAPITNPNTGSQNITASGGTLSIGTFAANDSLSGYTGNLVAGANPLNLFSASYTTLGSSATLAGGSINSFNGVRVKSGKSLSGYGTVTGPLDNQGTVTGGTAANFLHLTGAVTGPGSFQQNVVFESSYSPGNSAASVSLSGVTVFASTSQLKMEIGGTAQGSEYDHISDTGLLTLGGTLSVSIISGYIPAAGESFDLLDFDPAQTTGTFSTIQLPALVAGLSWNASRLYTDGVLSVNLQGDYNGNGTIDAADYVVYRNSLGQIGTALAADGNANGVIDSGDLDIWRTRFGQTAASGSISNATIPEPATCALALLATACCLRRRAKV